MACIRRRRNRWIVDFRDAAGIRRWVTCKTRRQAEAVLAQKLDESRQPREPAVDPDIRLQEYSERWLTLIRMTVKPRTLLSYQQILRLHVLPTLGHVKIRQLARGRIKMLLVDKIASNLSRNSVRIIHATLRALLNSAVDDGLLSANPSNKLGRSLKLAFPPAARQDQLKALNRQELARLLAVTTKTASRFYELFLLLGRTGLRLGEALALEWPHIDVESREIRVARAFSAGKIETPKSGHGRTVDMSRQLAATLRHLQIERKAETLKQVWKEMPPWVFCTQVGTPLDEHRVRKIFSRVIKDAGLPPHFTPHCLRHTFASLLLQQGESPAYVQRQLGHASIQLTVDTYGKWLPMGNKAAVNRLDDPDVPNAPAAPVTDPNQHGTAY